MLLFGLLFVFFLVGCFETFKDDNDDVHNVQWLIEIFDVVFETELMGIDGVESEAKPEEKEEL